MAESNEYFEEKFISEVKKRPLLYTVKTKSYKDSIIKNNLWLEIAEELGVEVEMLKKKWKTIRDYYTRIKRKLPTGSAAKRKCTTELQRLDSLRFLDGTYLLTNETISNVEDSSFVEESQADEEIRKAAAKTKALHFLWCFPEPLQ
ncbi:uncharacterized protein [Parasteatoda tepidariorum]|uniref:uncharacterized protein n=1 Tax=Parasteatoda tepidariorum TaxID=114398 RepID=UPI001C71EB7C|nr:uncharacterized protein LOC107452707 [Parasteatoda tepidariorum]